GFGSEEGIERLGNDVRRHAGARIGDRQGHVLACRQIQCSGDVTVYSLIGRLYRDASAFGHGVPGIDAQVQQSVFQLPGIDQRRPQS
nr:hypothetical protein [Tanacetum cinerariifolium]